MSPRLPFVPILLALLLAGAAPAHAAWSTSGNLVIETSKTEGFPYNSIQDAGTTTCPDMDGGLIVGWVRNSDSLYVSRLDLNGNRVWGTGLAGIHVNVGGNIAGAPAVVSDGNKGAWVVWADTRATTFGTYCQRYDFAGNPQFAAGGIKLGPNSTNAFSPRIAKSATGELLYAWLEFNASSDGEVHVQRVSLAGVLELGATGAIAYTGTSTIVQSPVEVFAEGDGAVVVYRESTGSPAYNRIGASRVSAAGVKQWGATGVIVEDGGLSNSVLTFAAAYNIYGLTVAWSSGSGSARQIRAQRVLTTGLVDWTVGGVSVVAANATGDVRVVPQGTQGGAIIGWMDSRDFNTVGANGFSFRDDIYAQRLDLNGTPTWNAAGQRVITLLNDNLGEQDEIEMVSDGADGAWFTFRDRLLQIDNATPNGDIKLVRLSSVGTSLFANWVNRESSAQHDEGTPVIAADNAGGALVAWEDNRSATDGPDVYAAHRGSTGAVYTQSLVLTSPNGGESFGSLEAVPVTWTSNVGGLVDLDYSVNNGAHVSIANNQADDGSFNWIVPGLNSTQVRMHVSESGDGVPSDSSNAFFSVCPSLTLLTVKSCGTSPLDIAAGDFLEDGLLDLIVANAGGVNFLRGNGAGDFTTNTANVIAGGARFLAVGDFNGDGRLDVVATTPTGVRLLTGNGAGSVGNGTFTLSPTVLLSGFNCTGIVAGDFNHDGIADLAVADSVSNRVRILKGAGAAGVGNGAFTAGATPAVGTQPVGIVTGDFNKDGHSDLAVANEGSNSVSVLLGNGDGTFGAAVAYAVGASPRHLATGDFDEDGITDLAVSCGNVINVDILLGNGSGGVGNGTFAAAVLYKTAGPVNEALVVADLDADGRADLVVANQGDFVQPFFGDGSGTTGDGTFTPGSTAGIPGITNAWGVTSGDFNGDGRPDIAVTNNGTANLTVYLGGCTAASPTLTVASPDGGENFFIGEKRRLEWNKGSGVLASNLSISTDGGTNFEDISTGETGSSFLWQVTAPASALARFRVLDPTSQTRQDQSNANFAICDAFAPADSFFTLTSSTTTVARCDFNKDGIEDIFYAATGGIVDQLGVGNGQFLATDTTHAGFGGEITLATGDFNADGLLDVVATLSGAVEVFLGAGANGVPDGHFATLQFYPVRTGVAAPDLVVGDFNGDGVSDIALAGTAADSVYVLLGGSTNGLANGSFGNLLRFPAGSFPQRIVTGDFNEDGALDLAVGAGATPFGVSILSGNGAGGFGAPALAPVAAAVRGIATGDFDEDGILDLAVCTANNVVTLKGNGVAGVGNGTFAAAQTVEALSAGTGGQIAVADVNRDGIADLFVSQKVGGGGALRWYPGQGLAAVGNGSFGAPLVRGQQNGGRLLLGDFDKDNILDIMIGGGSPGTETRDEMGCTPATGALSLTSPDGGQFLQIGTTADLTWTRPAFSQAVDLEVSRDGGQSFTLVASNVTGASYPWHVTGPASVNMRIRVTDAAWPTLTDVSAADNVVYLTAAGVGDGPGATAASFSPAWPNPARNSVSFTLALPSESPAFVDVFDLSGRRIRSLLHGVQPAGERRVVWDGRNEQGASVEGGLYFVRATLPGYEVKRRVVIVH